MDKSTNLAFLASILLVVLIALFLLFYHPSSGAAVSAVLGTCQVQKQSSTSLDYSVTNESYGTEVSGMNWITRGYVSVYNKDTDAGVFTVNCNFGTPEGTLSTSDAVYVMPGETKTAVCTVHTNLNDTIEFMYNVVPGTKTTTQVVEEQC